MTEAKRNKTMRGGLDLVITYGNLTIWFSIAGLQKKHYQHNKKVFPENLTKI
jgi:hypothetical protein